MPFSLVMRIFSPPKMQSCDVYSTQLIQAPISIIDNNNGDEEMEWVLVASPSYSNDAIRTGSVTFRILRTLTGLCIAW